MADVFISYAREDVGTAERFAHVLEARGWSVWWDRDLVAGREFDRVIETELQAARAVVVTWSPHSVQSRWVKSEASLAIDRGTMVPVLFGGVQAPFQFRTIHAVEFGEWDGEPAGQAIDWVFTAIAQLCEAPTTGSVPLPPPPPPPPPPAPELSPPPAPDPSPPPEEPFVGGDEESTRPRRWRRVVWGAVAMALVAAGLAGLATVRAVLDDHRGSTATTLGTTTTSSTTTAAPTTTAPSAPILHLGSTGGGVKELQVSSNTPATGPVRPMAPSASSPWAPSRPSSASTEARPA